MALSEEEIQKRRQKLLEKFAPNQNLGQGEYVEDLGDELLKSVGLKEFPKGSTEKVSAVYEALLDTARQGRSLYDYRPTERERVDESERKELEKLKSKADLNPQKYGEEYKATQQDIERRDFWYKYYDQARNELIESIAPYVSSTEATPEPPSPTGRDMGYRPIKSRKEDTTEKINDVLRRTRENMIREKRESDAWQQSERERNETRNLLPTGNDKIPYPEYSTEDAIGVPTAPATEPEPQDSYDPAKMKQWLDKTIAERRANRAQPSEIPNSQTTESPSSIDPARVGAGFKRQLLADELKRFAEGESKETAESLIEQGGEVGVSREQLSNLYKQYRTESEKGPTKLDGGSMFEQEEEQARARSKASGAFGGEDWRGRSSANSVSTPRLDQYASDAFGARPMGCERRVITSPEGQMRLMARKAARAGVDVSQLISANRGDVAAAFGELEEAGFAPKGIRSEEEAKARPALMAQRREAKAELLRRQAEQARAEREAAERAAKEEVARKEADRIAKEEADRKEKERLAKEEADRKEKERLAKEEEEKKEKERASQQGTSNPNSTQLTDSSSGTANRNSKSVRDSSPLANPNSRPTNPNRQINSVG